MIIFNFNDRIIIKVNDIKLKDKIDYEQCNILIYFDLF